MNTDTQKRYRTGVGVVLAKAGRQVFVGHRIKNASASKNFEAAWQLPQGGVDAGEEIEAAMWRELAEETGVRAEHARIIATSDWLQYDIPVELRRKLWKNGYSGQRQKWFLLEFLADDNAINLTSPGVPPEFDQWKWTNFDTMDQSAIYFKRTLYQEIQREFAGHIDQITS